MAQMKKQRRRTKHRGNAVGMIESRGRTGRKSTPAEQEQGKDNAFIKRRDRRQPPTWRAAINRAGISALLLFVLLLLIFKEDAATSFGLAAVAMAIYIPIGYATDAFIYKRQMEKDKAKS